MSQNSTPDKLHSMRHSMAHILANAVQHLWPNAKFGVGPVVENGFYYDIDLGTTTVSEDDFEKIEKEMKKIIAEDQPFKQHSMKIDQAILWAQEEDQPYKVDLLNDLKRAGTTVAKDLDKDELGTIAPEGEAKLDEVGFYTNGDFTDLCRGPHVESTGKVAAFKLMRVAGAYWRGKEDNPQMQRIYGVAFENEKDLRKHLTMLEEAKKRDHKKIGNELDLFFFHQTAPGMAYWLPRGVRMYNELVQFWREEHYKRGYEETVSPILNKKELYITSGHYDHYWEEMFTTEDHGDGHYGVKAMNCPNAMIIFGHKGRSYRDLPLRLGDTDNLHRNELSGALNGLFRVRQFRQDDAHIFVEEDQIKTEYAHIFEIVEKFYSIFGLEYSFRLGTRPDKFMGDSKVWDKAEGELKAILEDSGKEYHIEEGDGAFYGPKIDILMKDALGRPWQMGTIQLDFQQPLRFKLTYTDKNGKDKTPVAIHRVIYGSLERFIGIFLEHTAGRLPVWLSPEHVRVVTVNQEDATVKFAEGVAMKAKEAGLFVELDNDSESVGKKIRGAEVMKVPYTLVIGEKEIESGNVSPRVRKDLANDANQKTLSVDDFIKMVVKQTKDRSC